MCHHDAAVVVVASLIDFDFFRTRVIFTEFVSHRLRGPPEMHRICFSSSSKSPILSFFRFPLASRRLFLPRAPFGGPVFAKKRNQIPRNCRPPKKTRKLTCQCLVRSWGQRIAAGFGVQNAMVSDGVGAVSVFAGLSTDFD